MEIQRAAFVLLAAGVLFGLTSLALRDPRQRSPRNIARALGAIGLVFGLVLAVIAGGISL